MPFAAGSLSHHGSASTISGLPDTAHASIARSASSLSSRGWTTRSTPASGGIAGAAGSTRFTSKSCSSCCQSTYLPPPCCIGLRGSNGFDSGSVESTATVALRSRPTDTMRRAISYSRNGSWSGDRNGMVSTLSVGPLTARPSISTRPVVSSVRGEMPAARAMSSVSLKGSGSTTRSSTMPPDACASSSRNSCTRCA